MNFLGFSFFGSDCFSLPTSGVETGTCATEAVGCKAPKDTGPVLFPPKLNTDDGLLVVLEPKIEEGLEKSTAELKMSALVVV